MLFVSQGNHCCKHWKLSTRTSTFTVTLFFQRRGIPAAPSAVNKLGTSGWSPQSSGLTVGLNYYYYFVVSKHINLANLSRLPGIQRLSYTIIDEKVFSLECQTVIQFEDNKCPCVVHVVLQYNLNMYGVLCNDVIILS